MAASARNWPCSCPKTSCRANVRMTEAEFDKLAAAGLKVIATTSEHEIPNGVIVHRGPGWVAVGRRRGRAIRELRDSQAELECPIVHCPTCSAETIVSPTGHCLWCRTLLLKAAA